MNPKPKSTAIAFLILFKLSNNTIGDYRVKAELGIE
jgi:hypothetical protein